MLNELSDGSYTDCGLKVRDSVGNTAALSLGSFTVDTVAPSLSVTSSIPLATQDTTPSFSMEASEASTIAYSESCPGSIDQIQLGSNEITLKELSEGVYSNCTIQLMDAAGNQSPLYTFDSFLIDFTNPTLNLTGPIPSYVNDSTPSLVFGTSEPGTIAYEGACSSTTTSAVAGENEITLNSLGDGQYTDCKLKVTDSAGNTGVLLLGGFKVDTVAPSLNVTTSIPSVTRDTTPSFVVDVSEASAIVYSESCTGSIDQVQLGSNEITLNELSDGNYGNCSIQLTDTAGNQSELHTFAAFLIDSTNPTLGLTTPIANLVNDATPSFVFISTEPGTIVYEGACSSTKTSALTGSNEVTLNSLSDGQYTDCRLKVTDSAGNPGVMALGTSRWILLHLAPRSLRRFFH